MPGFFDHQRRMAAVATKALPTGLGWGASPLAADWRVWRGDALGYDYGRHDLSANSVVSLALNFIRQNVAAGRLVVGTDTPDGRGKEAKNHPLPPLLARPNKFHSWRTTLGSTAYCLRRWGYAYWLKLRNRLDGGIEEIQWVPNHAIEILWETELARQIKVGPIRAYRFTAGAFVKDYPPADVVHFRDGADPLCPYQGMGELRRQIRNAAAIDFGEALTVASLRNGHGGKVLAPKDAGGIVPETPDENEMEGLARRIEAGVSGENFGRVIKTSLAVDLLDVGLGPEEMALVEILDRPTSMLLAALGLNGVVLGVPSRDQSTYENKVQAYRDALRFGILPVQDLIADEIEHQLLNVDFEGQGADRCWWDRRYVDLEDPNERAQRAVTLRGGPVASENEARDLIDFPPVEGGEKTPAEEAAEGREQAAEIAAGQAQQPDDDQEDPQDESAATTRPDRAAKALTWLTEGDEDPAVKSLDWLDDAIDATLKAAPKAKAGAAGKGHWITVWSRRANRYVHIRVEGEAHTRGKRKVTAVRKGSPQELEDAVKRSLGEQAHMLDGKNVRVEHAPPQTKREEAFAKKAHAQGAVAVAIERTPKLREERTADATTYHVGGEQVRRVEPARHEDAHAFLSLSATDADRASFDPKGKWVVTSRGARGERDLDETFSTREKAERWAQRSAAAGVRQTQREESELITVRNLDHRTWSDDVYDPEHWTTTFRLITAEPRD